ncbi:hypothetical protein GO283_05107 [Ralstonia solanacearum]|nr:hypothetical protein [Ralstonia solanacearum]NJZ80970.1 hypothetical protein [Ralstonia solanacearum]NKA37060.1 hypothetical protein [Ralstonia solanacearum]NKA61061.1 hypothetical protein [Ralstonia solanacearum]NKA76305.1 hypothetical protein [Ralstonia solanacearum]
MLRLHVEVVLPRRQLQPDVVVARLGQPRRHADALPRMDARLLAHGDVGVLAAGQCDALAVGELQILPGDRHQARAAGQLHRRFALMRHLALRGGVACGRILLGGVKRVAIDHAGGGLLLLGQRRAVVLGGGQRCGLVRGGALAQRCGELFGLPDQRDAGGVVAGRHSLAARGVAVGGQQHAGLAAHRAIAIGAQLEALAPEAAAPVVLLMNQVPQVELTVSLRGGELRTQLAIAVVEDEQVGAAPAMLGALEAAEGGGVAVAFGLGAQAVPCGAVAGGEVALRAGGAVAAQAVEGLRVGLLPDALGDLPARGRRDARFALAVIERADHHRLVDVVFLELDQHLLADARQPLPAHARPGLPLRDQQPAGAAVIRTFALLPREADTDLAPWSGVVLRLAAGLGLAGRADHDGALHAPGGGLGVQAAGVGV